MAPSKIKLKIGNKIPNDKSVKIISRMIKGEIEDILRFENIFSPKLF